MYRKGLENMVSLDKIYHASYVLRDVIRNTELIRAPKIRTDCEVFLKPECLQVTGSFKVRGSGYMISQLTDEEKAHGVIACSAGNHAQGVALAATKYGIKSVICLPDGAPISKVEATKSYGAEVCMVEGVYDDAYKKAIEMRDEFGYTFIHPFDNENVIAGQGTIGLEILHDLDDVDVIVVPIGGGGLITGIAVAAKAIKPSVRIVGVQTEACPAMIKSYEDGVFYEEYPCEDSLCDSLIGGIGALSYAMAKDYVDDFIAVSEETIAKAVSFMAREEKYIVEAGSCTTVAAVMDYRERIGGRNIALVLSGGNIDGEVLYRLMAHTDYKVEL